MYWDVLTPGASTGDNIIDRIWAAFDVKHHLLDGVDGYNKRLKDRLQVLLPSGADPHESVLPGRDRTFSCKLSSPLRAILSAYDGAVVCVDSTLNLKGACAVNAESSALCPVPRC